MASTLPRDNTCNTTCGSEICCDTTETVGESAAGILHFETVAIAKVEAPTILDSLIAVTGASEFDTSGFYLSEALAAGPVDDVNTFQVGSVFYNRTII